MLEITHALVAGTIATHSKDPATAITLSFLSHFLLDAVPHWDFGTHWRKRRKLYTGIVAILDVIAGFILGYLLFGSVVPFPILFLCITASMLPDWMEAPWYIFFASPDKKEPSKNAGIFEKITFNIYRMENVFHHKTGFPLGAITQVVVVGFFYFLLR